MTLLKYEHIEIKESGDPLVDLSEFKFFLEPSYYYRRLSKNPRIYTRKTIAKKLHQIQTRLRDYRFKIWDGWRPREVQHNIYLQYRKQIEDDHPEWNEDRVNEEVGKFVTVADDPKKIPIHATGGSIDLTLADPAGKELDMGTEFDYFGPEAASLFYELNNIDQRVKANRRMLREAMVAEGFRFDDDEWWHFDYGNQLWAAVFNKPHAIYGECHEADWL